MQAAPPDPSQRLPATAAPPTTRALFLAFFGIGLIGFGGVLPWARRMIVEQRRWLSAAEFTDLLALCQFLPGANIVNLSISLGGRYRGARGALAALSGLLAAPILVVIGLGALYARYASHPVVAHAFAGLAAAAAGLVAATALRIASPLRARPLGIAVAAATVVVMAVLRVPLPAALALLVPASLFLHRKA